MSPAILQSWGSLSVLRYAEHPGCLLLRFLRRATDWCGLLQSRRRPLSSAVSWSDPYTASADAHADARDLPRGVECGIRSAVQSRDEASRPLRLLSARLSRRAGEPATYSDPRPDLPSERSVRAVLRTASRDHALAPCASRPQTQQGRVVRDFTRIIHQS